MIEKKMINSILRTTFLIFTILLMISCDEHDHDMVHERLDLKQIGLSIHMYMDQNQEIEFLPKHNELLKVVAHKDEYLLKTYSNNKNVKYHYPTDKRYSSYGSTTKIITHGQHTLYSDGHVERNKK